MDSRIFVLLNEFNPTIIIDFEAQIVSELSSGPFKLNSVPFWHVTIIITC